MRGLNHLDTDMNHIKHFIIHISLLAVLLLSACHDGHSDSDTGGRDSVYTAGYIQKIAFDEPEKALALLDTAEERRLLTSFNISDLRCMVYHNGLSHYKTAYAHALKAYNDPEARKNPEKFLSLVGIMAEECHNNGNYTGSVDYCAEGMKLARKLDDKTAEANLHVTWGLNLLEMEQYDEAFRHIDLAIGILDGEVRREPCYRTWDELFYALGMKLNLLWENDRYKEALAMRPSLEEALQGIETSEDTPEGVADMRRAEIDVSYCCIAYTVGSRAEGNNLLRRVEANPYTSTPDGEYVRIPCLILAKRYDEALHYIRREKALLKETTDTVNWDYINPHLQSELEAWQGKGNAREVARVQAAMLALTDTLRQRERTEDALELVEIYESEEKDAQIKEEQQESRTAWAIAGFVGVLLVVSGGFIVAIVRKNRGISRRNAALAAQVKDHVADQKELDRKTGENLVLRNELELARKELEAERAKNAPKQEPEQETPKPDENGDGAATEADRILFERIACEIKSRQLFRNPNFSRTELLKIIPVPQNKFAGLFKQFAGKPFTAYIQDLRFQYANELFVEHPDWSIDAIIKECGLSRTAFYTFFVRKFGVKPEELRKNIRNKQENEDSVTCL